MKTGWQYLGNKWYYLHSSGAVATGWYQEGSTWYYLHASNGDMKTGWFQVNGKWYYAYGSGALASMFSVIPRETNDDARFTLKNIQEQLNIENRLKEYIN